MCGFTITFDTEQAEMEINSGIGAEVDLNIMKENECMTFLNSC